MSDKILDKVSDPYWYADHDPDYGERFDAIKELKGLDDGSLHRGSGFRRVASLIAPLEDLAKVIEPDFLLDKRKFYDWLDAHPEYCTYDRRRFRAKGMLENGILAPDKLFKEGDMPVVFKQAKYSGTHQDDSPPVPDSGQSQPLLDTSGSIMSPDISFGDQPTGNRGGQVSAVHDMPTSGAISHPLPGGTISMPDTTDVHDPGSQGSDRDDPAIFKGSKSNG